MSNEQGIGTAKVIMEQKSRKRIWDCVGIVHRCHRGCEENKGLTSNSVIFSVESDGR